MAQFGFKELATSDGLNTKTHLKTEQGQLVTGTFGSDDGNGLSGDALDNHQKQINKSLGETFDVIVTTNDQIEIKKYRGEQIYTVEGNAGAASLNALPFDLTNATEDVDITLIGKSDTNHVTISHNPVAGGIALIGGNAQLKANHQLRLRYIAALNLVIDCSRNF